METKEQLIQIASDLMIANGYNAFSYKTISEKIGIKTSSIHYHFPAKVDLGIAVVESHRQALQHLRNRTQNADAITKLGKLFKYYQNLASEGKVCIAGALASDIGTLEEDLRAVVIQFSEEIMAFLVSIFEQGQLENSIPKFKNNETKTRNVFANLMALLQFNRIDQQKADFTNSINDLWEEITIKN